MKTIAALAIAASLAGLPAQAATVLNFDELAHDGPGVRYINEAQVQSNGFSFTSGTNTAPVFGIYARNDARNADAGGATLYHRWSNTPLTIARMDGAAFDLISIDFADLENKGSAVSNLINFFDAAGKLIGSTEFMLDGKAGLQTISFNQKGVYSASLYAPTGSWTQFDNFTIADVVSGVPEPGAWAMMIIGFFALGSAVRRRRSAAAAVC